MSFFLSRAHALLEVARHFLLDELAVALFNPQSLEITSRELRQLPAAACR